MAHWPAHHCLRRSNSACASYRQSWERSLKTAAVQNVSPSVSAEVEAGDTSSVKSIAVERAVGTSSLEIQTAAEATAGVLRRGTMAAAAAVGLSPCPVGPSATGPAASTAGRTAEGAGNGAL